MAAQLTAAEVGARLEDPATRAAALEALEQHAGPHDRALALAAAKQLGALAAADEALVDVPTARRVGLLLARMITDALDDDPMPVFAAAYGEGRMIASYMAPTVVNNMLRAAQEGSRQLSSEDALTYACVVAPWMIGYVRGGSPLLAAIGFPVKDAIKFFSLARSAEGVSTTRARMPEDDVPLVLASLLLELLSKQDLPELVAVGAWYGLFTLQGSRPAVSKRLFQDKLFSTARVYLASLGSAADRLAISRGKGRAGMAVQAVTDCMRNAEHTTIPGAERKTFAECGLLAECEATVAAFEAGGEAGLGDTDHVVLTMS